CFYFFVGVSPDGRYVHAFPTRRSSDLAAGGWSRGLLLRHGRAAKIRVVNTGILRYSSPHRIRRRRRIRECGASMHGPTPGQPGPMIHRLDAVASTQDEAAAHWDGRQGHAAAPVEAPYAILAREQTAGRGRLGRRFVSPPGGALALTVAHRSAVPPAARSWFPLAAGLAVIDTLSAVLGPAGSGGAQQ